MEENTLIYFVLLTLIVLITNMLVIVNNVCVDHLTKTSCENSDVRNLYSELLKTSASLTNLRILSRLDPRRMVSALVPWYRLDVDANRVSALTKSATWHA